MNNDGDMMNVQWWAYDTTAMAHQQKQIERKKKQHYKTTPMKKDNDKIKLLSMYFITSISHCTWIKLYKVTYTEAT